MDRRNPLKPDETNLDVFFGSNAQNSSNCFYDVRSTGMDPERVGGYRWKHRYLRFGVCMA